MLAVATDGERRRHRWQLTHLGTRLARRLLEHLVGDHIAHDECRGHHCVAVLVGGGSHIGALDAKILLRRRSGLAVEGCAGELVQERAKAIAPT